MRWFLLGVLVLVFAGCGDNECSVDSDCSEGGVCAEGGGVVFASRVCVYDEQSDLGEPKRDFGPDAGPSPTDGGGMSPTDMDVDQAEECVPRLNQEICLSISAECGTPEVEECGETIELSCGQCTSPLTCSDTFQCECVAETDDTFCTRFGAACGSLENLDNCGDSRVVDCGACSGEEVCGERAPNVCGCPCEIGQDCFADGAQNPDNPCEVCDPAQSTSAWTIASGRSCDDGDQCTENDVCGADGTCAGDAVQCTAPQCRTASCDPDTGACVESNSPDGMACLGGGPSCVAHECSSGTCQDRVRTGSCLINGDCYEHGDRNPSNECEWCHASSSSSWTVATGQSCTDDGLTCTDDVCDSSGSCIHPIVSNQCLINGSCYSAGESPNFNCCRGCDPFVSQIETSPINVGSPCASGCTCSTGGACVSGANLCLPEQCI